MNLIIKQADTLVPLHPALQMRGSESWERRGVAESAFHLLENEQDMVNLADAAANGMDWKIGNVLLEIRQLHSDDGRMRFEDHLCIYQIIPARSESVEVTDKAEALAVCKARSPNHGVTMQEGGKRTRMDKIGNIETCGTRNPFTDEFIADSVPVIATFTSRELFAVLI